MKLLVILSLLTFVPFVSAQGFVKDSADIREEGTAPGFVKQKREKYLEKQKMEQEAREREEPNSYRGKNTDPALYDTHVPTWK